MLSEFYSIFIFIVPVVVFVLSFSKAVNSKFNEENKMHSSIYSFFMKENCGRYAKCSDSQIEVTDAYKIKIRKPSKALGFATNKGGVKNEPLDLFYKEFEQKIKVNTGQ